MTGRQIEATYREDGPVRFWYRHLAFLGPESIAAAEAAECAGEQGRFWEYHDALFAVQQGRNGGTFSRDNLKAVARELKLNTNDFGRCVDSGRYNAHVRAEIELAQKAGVNATPTVMVNDFKIDPPTFENIQAAIQIQLRK